jgi:hypothetical protein
MSATAISGHTPESLEQEAVVGGVELDAAQVVATGEAFGMHARCSVERFDAEAGVVGEGEQGGSLGEVAGLGCGVLLEAGEPFERVFGGVGGEAGSVQIEEIGSDGGREQLPDLAQLVVTAGGDEQAGPAGLT